MTPDEESQLRQRLRELQDEHHELDELVDRLTLDPAMNQLELRRLKKRKLALKDAIARIQSQIIPDILA